MKKEFPNGLTLLIRENHSAPLVTADLWVRCGAADEPPAVGGMTHFLEHLVFKGSDKIAVGEYDRLIENLGGYLNAATSLDYTHYFFTVPSKNFEEALEGMAGVVTQASIDPVELEKERKVVLEEIRRKQDSPQNFLYERLMEESYAQGPYQRPVLGTPETLTSMTREQILSYHRSHYRPENVTAIVVGDIKTDEAAAAVQRLLGQGDWKRGGQYPAPAYSRDKNQYQWGVRKEYEKDLREAYLMMSFPAPGIRDGSGAAPVVRENAEAIAADLASQILGGSRASRLWQEVREKKQLVSSVSLGYSTMRDESLFVISATLEPKNLEAAEKAILAEIERFANEGPDAGELERAKKSIHHHYLYEMETNSGQCSTVGYFYTITGSTEFEENYLVNLEKITGSQVKECARKFLKAGLFNRLAVVPAKGSPEQGNAEKGKK